MMLEHMIIIVPETPLPWINYPRYGSYLEAFVLKGNADTANREE